MSLQEVIDERVSFLKEQINPKNDSAINEVFQRQIDVLRRTDIEKVAYIILQRKTLLKNCREPAEAERLFTELEALEWLQRQVVRYV